MLIHPAKHDDDGVCSKMEEHGIQKNRGLIISMLFLSLLKKIHSFKRENFFLSFILKAFIFSLAHRLLVVPDS